MFQAGIVTQSTNEENVHNAMHPTYIKYPHLWLTGLKAIHSPQAKLIKPSTQNNWHFVSILFTAPNRWQIESFWCECLSNCFTLHSSFTKVFRCSAVRFKISMQLDVTTSSLYPWQQVLLNFSLLSRCGKWARHLANNLNDKWLKWINDTGTCILHLKIFSGEK